MGFLLDVVFHSPFEGTAHGAKLPELRVCRVCGSMYPDQFGDLCWWCRMNNNESEDGLLLNLRCGIIALKILGRAYA